MDTPNEVTRASIKDYKRNQIRRISFPNTVDGNSDHSFTIGRNCDNIIEFCDRRGAEGMLWFNVMKCGITIAHIKKSVCNVYY